MTIAVIIKGQQLKPEISLQQQIDELLLHRRQQEQQQQQIQQIQQLYTHTPFLSPNNVQTSLNNIQGNGIKQNERLQQLSFDTTQKTPIKVATSSSDGRYTLDNHEFIREFSWNLFQVLFFFIQNKS